MAAYMRVIQDESDVMFLYDDTMLGGAREGFSLSVDTLLWKNLAEDSKALKLGKIKKLRVSGDRNGWKIYADKEAIDVTSVDNKAANALCDVIRIARKEALKLEKD